MIDLIILKDRADSRELELLHASINAGSLTTEIISIVY